MDLQTTSVHFGVDKDTSYNSVITPIYQTSTFRFEDIGKTKGYVYTRSANPTRTALEENLAALEGGLSAKASSFRAVSHYNSVTFFPRRRSHNKHKLHLRRNGKIISVVFRIIWF